MKKEFILNLDGLLKKYFHAVEWSVLLNQSVTESQYTNLIALGITSPLIMRLYYLIFRLKNNSTGSDSEDEIIKNLSEKQKFIRIINTIICSSLEKVLRELNDKDSKNVQEKPLNLDRDLYILGHGQGLKDDVDLHDDMIRSIIELLERKRICNF